MESIQGVQQIEEHRQEAARFPRIDRRKLAADINLKAREIRLLKDTMRASGHEITSLEAWKLGVLKVTVTNLCGLAACAHGRLHLPVAKEPAADQKAAALLIAPGYMLPEAPRAA